MNDLNGKKVVLFGGAGFIGHNLVPASRIFPAECIFRYVVGFERSIR